MLEVVHHTYHHQFITSPSDYSLSPLAADYSLIIPYPHMDSVTMELKVHVMNKDFSSSYHGFQHLSTFDQPYYTSKGWLDWYMNYSACSNLVTHNYNAKVLLIINRTFIIYNILKTLFIIRFFEY